MTNLNHEQYAAATAPLGHNLIIASAGTGKTSTIVARIAHLLDLGIDPKRILLLTFTNKAAEEMINRLSTKFNQKTISQITAGTFHAVSNALLKKLGKGVILKQPSELKILLKSLVERRKFHHISDLNAYGGAYLYDIYSLFCNSCVRDESFSEWFSANYGDQAVFADIYEDILREFELEKARFNYADFNDLLINMRNELKNNAQIEFDEILVDEYQDTNSLQGSLIDAFNTKSLFCVGDFDQSIYAFNGANIKIIGSFKDRYKNAQIYTLNTNYRSSEKILNLANKVIANNPRLYPKQLKVSRNGEFKSPQLMIYKDIKDEYSHIAQIICETAFDKTQTAIIFRNNSSADGIEIALREKNIKCRRKGSVSFFESREIKALIDIVGIFVNPKDIMAFISVFEYAKGMGNAKSKDIFDKLCNLGDGNLINGLLNPDPNAKMHEKKAKNYELGLFDDFEEINGKAKFSSLNLGEFANHRILNNSNLSEDGALFLSNLNDFIRQIKGKKDAYDIFFAASKSKIYAQIADILATKRAMRKNGTIDENLKSENLAKINSKALDLLQMSKQYGDCVSFYNFLTLGKNEIDEGEGVNLLTVHASKGLEFAQVFVVDLAEGRFPNFKLMSMGGSLEEERRLFYVAVTRAKDELYLTYAQKDSLRKIDYKPSIFLKEAGLIKDN